MSAPANLFTRLATSALARRDVLACAGVTLGGGFATAHAQDYPVKPVKQRSRDQTQREHSA